MKPIDFFKLQAKNLFKDYKTQTSYFDAEFGGNFYKYNPQYFDIDGIVEYFEIDEDDFTLMNAQHIIAQLVGFRKWTEMVVASETELELAKLLFDNLHKISAEEWHEYISGVETDNNLTINHEFRLEVFQKVFAEVESHQSHYQDFRLKPKKQDVAIIKKPLKKTTPNSDVQITSLPLSQKEQRTFIETANSVFKAVIERMEPSHPELTRKLWNAEYYINNVLLPEIKLPISRDYALSLIDSFLVHHVLELVVRADEMATATELMV